ncbi:hypothetical protein K450DRAFT_263878 [Umbelopsis ramanniana AG]|uniref:Uncharacterized protein n=1 Tax=Umbelopsis ramanniana AG TaxID=1314678 RepID=A0AAD5H9I4_UMBRA|nr:uncharacterized protein K450DRAFT_263878 [Umbelopsis ramanniana AG]KAI8574979.1 hypothetical protein K450DRAFT_263878 [Umbelopsis ramanniana AG]
MSFPENESSLPLHSTYFGHNPLNNGHLKWTLNITQNHKSGLCKDFPVNFYVHTPQEQSKVAKATHYSKAYIVKFRCLPNVTFWSTFHVHIPKNKIHFRSDIRSQLSQNVSNHQSLHKHSKFYFRTCVCGNQPKNDSTMTPYKSPNIRPNHARTIKQNTQIHQTKVLFRNR